MKHCVQNGIFSENSPAWKENSEFSLLPSQMYRNGLKITDKFSNFHFRSTFFVVVAGVFLFIL